MVQVQAPRTIRYIFVNLTCHYFMLYLCFETFYFYFYSDPRHLIFEKNCHKPRNIKCLANRKQGKLNQKGLIIGCINGPIYGRAYIPGAYNEIIVLVNRLMGL